MIDKRVAWIMSRFPRFTETFVYNEIRAARDLGVNCVAYPLRRDRVRKVQPGGQEILPLIRFVPYLSIRVVLTQLWWLRRAPIRYLRALVDALVGTWGSARLFLVAIVVFPKVAHIARCLQKERVSHVHCHFATHPTLAGFLIRRLTGITYSFTAHHSDLRRRQMLKQKVLDAAFVVAISEFNRNLIIKSCGREIAHKIHVVHCGVDLSVFAPPAQRTDDGTFSIACVGRIAPWKGQHFLVEACGSLVRRGVPLHCRIVGGDGDLDGLRRHISALGLDRNVELLGWRSQSEVAQLLEGSDVLVAPSAPAMGRREGIPVVLMEAMAAELPVVASRLTGIPELVIDGETGILVPPADVPALTEALESLFRDPEMRRRLGAAGRKHVWNEFELRKNTTKLMNLVAKA